MQDDPYMAMIEAEWANIVLVYQTFRGKDQIIQYDIEEQKIHSYPVDEFVQNLTARTREQTARIFAEATRRNQFLLFIKDTKNQRLTAYTFDLPE